MTDQSGIKVGRQPTKKKKNIFSIGVTFSRIRQVSRLLRANGLEGAEQALSKNILNTTGQALELITGRTFSKRRYMSVLRLISAPNRTEGELDKEAIRGMKDKEKTRRSG